MRPWIALPFLALALSTAATAAADERAKFCGIFPPDMPFYGGWSGCNLKQLRQPALWQGLPKDAQQVIRLTFTDGHAFFWRSVTITRMADGTGLITVLGTSRPTSIRPPMKEKVHRRLRLSPDDLARIDRLAEAAGVFEFERGTWDGTGDDKDEIYMHCQTLDMERINAAGYRVSVVNIGCNQPKKLMPFVNEVVRLAKMKNGANGQLFY